MKRSSLLLLTAIFLVSCSNQPLQTANQYGTVSIVAVATDVASFAQVAKKAEIIVTANDMSQASKVLSVSENAVKGVMNQIPSGKNRKFDMRICDSAGTIKYRGTTTADVETDQIVNVPITLVRTSGDVVIQGTIVEDSVTTGYQYYKITINTHTKALGATNGPCIVETHFLDDTANILTGYTLLTNDSVTSGPAGLFNGDNTAGTGYTKPFISGTDWNLTLNMGTPHTFTALFIALWEVDYYGYPSTMTVSASGSISGPWTQIGTRTWTGAFVTSSINLFY